MGNRTRDLPNYIKPPKGYVEELKKEFETIQARMDMMNDILDKAKSTIDYGNGNVVTAYSQPHPCPTCGICPTCGRPHRERHSTYPPYRYRWYESTGGSIAWGQSR